MNEAIAIEPGPDPISRQAAPPITTNPEKLGGTPTIAGTRLPVTALLDHLLMGYDINEFLNEFDGVKRSDVEAVLAKIKEALAEGWLAERVNY
jgi:uncharacterized protein (DUF433 family)